MMSSRLTKSASVSTEATNTKQTKRLLHCGALLLGLSWPTSLFAAGSPWENAVSVLEAAFTGPIARGLSLVSIVVGGLLFAFGEGDSKRTLAGIVFGVGMALGAVNFMGWLFN
jgi:type IV secretory pathway VirB2 component (pilin)